MKSKSFNLSKFLELFPLFSCSGFGLCASPRPRPCRHHARHARDRFARFASCVLCYFVTPFCTRPPRVHAHACTVARAAAAPVMETPPQNATVLDGKDATLSCRAAGSPAPNTTWIFMGKYRSRLPRPRRGVPLGVPHPPEEGPRRPRRTAAALLTPAWRRMLTCPTTHD